MSEEEKLAAIGERMVRAALARNQPMTAAERREAIEASQADVEWLYQRAAASRGVSPMACSSAVAEEREACARVADGYDTEIGGADNPASLIAAAIRARGPAAEHPAVALLREIEWSGGLDESCPSCGAARRPRGELDPEGRHTPGCRLAALLRPDEGRPEDLRARLEEALEAILPAGSQVRLDVTLPGKVDRIEATIGFKDPEPAPPDLQAIINEVAKKVAPDYPPPRLTFERAPAAGTFDRPPNATTVHRTAIDPGRPPWRLAIGEVCGDMLTVVRLNPSGTIREEDALIIEQVLYERTAQRWAVDRTHDLTTDGEVRIVPRGDR